MPARRKRRFWRVCRIYFRRFRLTVWFLVLGLLCFLVYLNQVGLPGFLKRPLLEKLHERGIALQFSRLRLSWYHGLVADNVRFGSSDDPYAPQFTAAEVRVKPNYRALAHLQFSQIDSLSLRRGRLIWPIADTNQPESRELSVTNIQAVLRLLPNDEWALDKFQGNFAGAMFQLSGTITNASALRDWKFFQPGQHRPTPAGAWQRGLRRFADALERIHFSAPPDLRLDLRGDARDLQSFSLRTTITAPGADTPWGTVSEGQLRARLFPASNEWSRVELALDAAGAQTRWANTKNLHLTVHLASLPGLTNTVDGSLVITAGEAQTRWAQASHARLTVQWTHALTNPIPLAGQAELQAEHASTAWGNARKFQLRGQFARALPRPAPPEPDWGFWTNLEPYLISWQGRLTDLQSSNLLAQEVACSGTWSAPELAITNCQARLYQGRFDAHAALNVDTRALRAGFTSDFDPHQLGPLLSTESRRWLEEFSWAQAPVLQAEGSVVLPAWTNRQPDWRAEVLPTLSLEGEFDFPRGGSYSNVLVSTAHSHFLYSNQVLRLPDLRATRPEGELRASHEADGRTREYYWRVSSTIDPRVVRPLLGTNEQRAFDLVTFTQPPVLEAELWGRFNNRESLGFKGRVAVTNFTFRGLAATSLQTAVQYTNRVLQCLQPRVLRGEQLMQAQGLTADFNQHLVFLTNGFSTGDPMFIARVIGPQVVRAIEPYRFLEPPTAYVNGTVPMHGEEGADLNFELSGGPFQWLEFNLAHVAGQIHWLGETLTLTNVAASLYGGHATGNAHFEFWPGGGADYTLKLATTDTQLRSLLADLSGNSNKIEGRLTGTLNITKANTEDPQHVQGYGTANLRDGLIWSIPLFGMFSPVLNEIKPGLGTSRFSSGTCTFTISNSVIRSDDLEIRSPAVRLLYRGTVDFDYRVKATVEAEVLKDLPGFGPLLSTATLPFSKLFVYKVTGTLSDPKKEPVSIFGRALLAPFQFPFHPWRTLEGLLPEDLFFSRTNSPAGNGPPKFGP